MITRILDTNVLLDRPITEVIDYFEPCRIVIPFVVIKELDTFKTSSNDLLKSNARITSNFLDQIRSLGHLYEGVTLESGHVIRVELGFSDTNLPIQRCFSLADYTILQVAVGIKNIAENDVVLVTQDTNIRILADVLGIKSENFGTIVNHRNLYTGYSTLLLSNTDLCSFVQGGYLPATISLRENEYVMGGSSADPGAAYVLGKYRNGIVIPLNYSQKVYDIKAANTKQRFLIDALMDPDISLVTSIGPAGSGKTLLALAAALEQNRVIGDTGRYNKILLTRSTDPMGKDIGFLPGGELEKMTPWARGAFDNLDYLARGFVKSKNGKWNNQDSGADEIMNYNVIDIQATTYIRGRSIPDQFIIIDEAQNMTPHEIKTIVTRVGKGTKIVILGDIEQIDNMRLNINNNGLVHLIDAFKDQKCSAHVTLTETERSEIADLASKLL